MLIHVCCRVQTSILTDHLRNVYYSTDFCGMRNNKEGYMNRMDLDNLIIF